MVPLFSGLPGSCMFYKMVHYMPLPKLLSAEETVEVLLLYISKAPGLPKDIFYDLGPWFSAKLWSDAFLKFLSVFSFSGFYPHPVGCQIDLINNWRPVFSLCAPRIPHLGHVRLLGQIMLPIPFHPLLLDCLHLSWSLDICLQSSVLWSSWSLSIGYSFLSRLGGEARVLLQAVGTDKESASLFMLSDVAEGLAFHEGCSSQRSLKEDGPLFKVDRSPFPSWGLFDFIFLGLSRFTPCFLSLKSG